MELTAEAVADGLARFERRPETDVRGHAAVGIVLHGAENGTDFWITKRAATLRAHAGQWALPGGRVDAGESSEEAALRELDEELGITLAGDSVLGLLDDYVTRSGFCVTPVVIWAGGNNLEPIPNPDEVASVHSVPVREIDVEPRFISIPESTRPVIQVPMLGSRIHAPTGALLYQFREVVLHGRSTRVAHLEQPVFAWR